MRKKSFYIITLGICSFLLLYNDIAISKSADNIFPKIKGWKLNKNILCYSPETLYEYINGAAELYLKYSFVELKTAEYTRRDKSSVIVEIYRHQTSLDAYGIFSQERSAKGEFLDIGTQSYFEDPFINFIAGDYYIKIYSYDLENNTKEILQEFARNIDRTINTKNSLPYVIERFPTEAKVAYSEIYVAQDFLGYEFFRNGYSAEYVIEDKKFRLFIIEGSDSKECLNMLNKYNQIYDSLMSIEENIILSFDDPYHRGISLIWLDRYIWGILNITDAEVVEYYLTKTKKLLFK